MTFLLFITTLGVILLGYLVMCRLDNFLERGGILDSPQGRVNQGVLVYGAPDVAEKINRAGMKCRNLAALPFPEDGLYSALFALSGDDRGNLAICHAAKHADPGITIIARCSAPELRGVFETMGANRLLGTDESIDALLAELWGASR
ncbi:MAG: NAD-binding protein [Lawsonibacter sp.]|nr:NAD-binding protein [Lawsonibacter sp.]